MLTSNSDLRPSGGPPSPGALSAHSDGLCQQVLALCRPELSQPLQWLNTLYVRLSDNLFPDEASGHGAAPLTRDQAAYLAALEEVLARKEEPFDPLLDLIPLDPSSLSGSRVEDRYPRFAAAVADSHLLALLRIGREIMPFDPASHTIGVHNVALHTGMLAAQAGLPVDLPLVSAASLCHDIGKFGCRGEDAQRIPYLHYYYTWQWLSLIHI